MQLGVSYVQMQTVFREHDARLLYLTKQALSTSWAGQTRAAAAKGQLELRNLLAMGAPHR